MQLCTLVVFIFALLHHHGEMASSKSEIEKICQRIIHEEDKTSIAGNDKLITDEEKVFQSYDECLKYYNVMV